MFKFTFFVPESHLETVKKAVFAVGAGQIGYYDHCCWLVKGEGQFRPLEGSEPWLGEQSRVERVIEYKVEMVCADECIDEVIAVFREAHPYETPAFEVMALDSRSAS